MFLLNINDFFPIQIDFSIFISDFSVCVSGFIFFVLLKRIPCLISSCVSGFHYLCHFLFEREFQILEFCLDSFLDVFGFLLLMYDIFPIDWQFFHFCVELLRFVFSFVCVWSCLTSVLLLSSCVIYGLGKMKSYLFPS